MRRNDSTHGTPFLLHCVIAGSCSPILWQFHSNYKAFCVPREETNSSSRAVPRRALRGLFPSWDGVKRETDSPEMSKVEDSRDLQKRVRGELD